MAATAGKFNHLAPVLAGAAAAVGVGGLFPLAFGMEGLSTPIYPLAGAVFLLVLLGGPLLLLASGFHVIATRLGKRWFLVLFTVLLIIAGLALFWAPPTHDVLVDWMVMSLGIALIAAVLRQDWVWAVVGGLWTAVLLGFICVQTALQYLSPTYGGTPGWWWPFWLLGCILALTTAIVAFMRRGQTATSSLSR